MTEEMRHPRRADLEYNSWLLFFQAISALYGAYSSIKQANQAWDILANLQQIQNILQQMNGVLQTIGDDLVEIKYLLSKLPAIIQGIVDFGFARDALYKGRATPQPVVFNILY